MDPNFRSRIEVNNYPWTTPQPSQANYQAPSSPSYNPTGQSASSPQNLTASPTAATPKPARPNWVYIVVFLVFAAVVTALVVALVVIVKPNDLSSIKTIIPCNSSEAIFQCSDGTCVKAEMKCDSIIQCPDNSDEENCPTTANAGGGGVTDNTTPGGTYVFTTAPSNGTCNTAENFLCANGNCIQLNFVCEGFNDCGDNSDEANCTCDTPDRFKCTSGQCLVVSWRCDGFYDCTDQSDEEGCVCTDKQYRCANNERCIPTDWVCDGDDDCKGDDPLDEANCTSIRTTTTALTTAPPL